jgi:hypothetical protein
MADEMNTYQASDISKVDLLSALNEMGVRLFNIPISPRFTKTYKLSINLDEYVNGKKVSTKNISPNSKNTYYYYVKEEQYADYMNKIKFITRDLDSTCLVNVNVMGNSMGGILKKHKERKYQFYSWRSYSATKWKLGIETPLLNFSSSWYDKKYDIERSCGAVDLSLDKASTDDLLKNSPHYFIISYMISE